MADEMQDVPEQAEPVRRKSTAGRIAKCDRLRSRELVEAVSGDEIGKLGKSRLRAPYRSDAMHAIEGSQSPGVAGVCDTRRRV